MTAHPDPIEFKSFATPSRDMVALRPKITEHYWGYEARMNEQVLSLVVCLRAIGSLMAGASTLAAVGVWLLPATAFAGGGIATKCVASAFLLCLAFMVGRFASRGMQVRVQLDTAKGELREVVDGPLDSVVTLASYGLDAVEAVEVVASKNDASFGQIQIQIAGVGRIPVADGTISMLHPLQDRMIRDCHVESADPAQPAIWAGPLAA